MRSTVPPSWSHCGHSAVPVTDPVGCRGIRIPGRSDCLAHLDPAHRTVYLSALTAGADIDHCGTTFTHGLLSELLNALRDQTTGLPTIGRARFDGARFDGEADFADVTFNGPAEFDGAVFSDYGRFKAVQFNSTSSFAGVQFSEASFEKSVFVGAARFMHAKFEYDSRFERAHFSSLAIFVMTHFKGSADFAATVFEEVRLSGARFGNIANFSNATFSKTSVPGPFVCASLVTFEGAVFEAPVTLEIAAATVYCAGTRWEYRAELRLRYADLDLRYAVLSAPTAVTFHAAPFKYLSTPLPEAVLSSGHDPSVRVTSVQGVDASFLVLTDADLTHCLFTGAFHLDQIHIGGSSSFAPVPEGIHLRGRIWPVKWSKRRTIAEEHHWRALAAGLPAQPSGATLWHISPHHGDPARTPGPEDVSAVYRQLRKAFEDAKNEPGAADFYYGEMEMRRHSRATTPRGERGLLHAYWFLSGYGLRASRAAGWLIVAMTTTVLLLMGLGLPQNAPNQEASGAVPAGGGRVSFIIDKDDPQNPTHDRFTGKRFDKALNVTLNSVIFRSSGQDLTTAGTYIEMGSRLLEPVLLALAVLAIRGRIKR